jgi:hypothetical protein
MGVPALTAVPGSGSAGSDVDPVAEAGFAAGAAGGGVFGSGAGVIRASVSSSTNVTSSPALGRVSTGALSTGSPVPSTGGGLTAIVPTT